MNNAAEDRDRVVVNLQERRLDRTVLRTYRTKASLEEIVPNEKQPRLGPKIDEELQRQIEANGGLFEPLLVEPHPQLPGKFRIIDGDRRWSNSKVLVEQGKEEYRQIPVEVTDRTLSEEDRLRVWIYIHRQRKEWDAKEKEMVAYRLVDLMGRASAANILGITVRELDKLTDVFELSEKFTALRDPGAAITWARELMGVSKKLLTPSVVEAVVRKVNQKRITNSKDLRKLRAILPDPIAKAHFLADAGDLESAALRLGTVKTKSDDGLTGELDAVVEAVKAVPWTTLQDLKGNAELLKKIDDAEAMLRSLRKALS
ncbi:ParB N-terminal domain-containing protein [Bradyrhizobium barranii subsp. apii]|uniref:ParB N-terminal domain-containing protein n=1 Tax=Bradyrhizobium barranii subsp. apii TaxID=2819348 RepID=A0A8T5V6R7_9BRAD|nr:ParB N-terminal domain-containing protein [Bradyrhizobium barranii]UPT88002.1 ParB N-terminal domain-containing protein [Bradyrhizobium barranii subsp. apii]